MIRTALLPVIAGAFFASALVSSAPTMAQKLQTGRKKVDTTKPQVQEEDVPEEYKDTPPVLRFKMRDIDGNDINLKDFKGKVIVMVNTASECGYKDQLGDLEELYKKHKDDGLVILAFPSNDFQQEPKEGAALKKWCEEKYKVSFLLFERVQVKDPASACDLYKFLTDKKKNPTHGGDIKWNYTKFVIDRKGEIRGRFEKEERPTGKKMTALIERLLKVKVGKTGDKPKEGDKNEEGGAAGGKKPEKPKAKSM